MENIVVVPVLPSLVPSLWELAQEKLGRVVEFCDGEFLIEDFYEPLCTGRLTLWMIYDPLTQKLFASAITEVVHYTRVSVLKIIAVGGAHMDTWLAKLDDAFCAYIDAIGVDRIELVGRKGWVRRLKDLGYRETNVVMLKEI